MADIKISELTQVSALNNGDLVEVSQVNALAPSGYTSLKASMTDLGKKVNADIEYTTDLADFEEKTALGAIKETAKDKNVADEYDDTQTYDKGDVVIYKNTLYICTTNNTTGTWDASKWTATTVQSLIGSLSSLTTTDKSSLVGAVNEVNTGVTNATTKTSGTITAGTGCVVRLGSLTKINGCVYGSFSINMTTPISSRTTIGTIPVGFKPYANVSYLAPSSSAINYFQDRITNVIITTSGDIIAGDIFYPSGQTIKEITLSFSYNQGN